MQDIYTYIPETNNVTKEYNVAAILSLLFMVPISLVPASTLMYFIIIIIIIIIYLCIFNCNWTDTRWQQYSTHLHTNSTQNTENRTRVYIIIKRTNGKCGPCPVFASYTAEFALQLGKKHGKTSVRVVEKCPRHHRYR
jgi:hypothetical protein